MIKSIRTKLFKVILVAMVISLSGCTDDESSITSGGGGSGVASDGGSTSAKFAGTYTGTATLSISGSSIGDSSSTRDVTLLVRSNGTAQLTIDGDTIEGFVNGNTFGFSIQIVEKDGFVDCRATAILTGTIIGKVGSGTISGSGSCEVLTAKTGFSATGSLSVSKL